jgi:hypothetical protein
LSGRMVAAYSISFCCGLVRLARPFFFTIKPGLNKVIFLAMRVYCQ